MDKESDFLMSTEELHERDLTEAQLQRIKKIEEDDFRWLMADKRGRRIMWRLLEKTRVYQSSFYRQFTNILPRRHEKRRPDAD